MAALPSPIDRYRDAELTLQDLVDAAARLLARLEVRPVDGRVAQAPDVRGVRYYQGIGVLDRPVRYDGRRAVYGFRHLLQLLAVKRLQQEGHPLHLIQQSLAGCPTPVLEQALERVLAGRGRTSDAVSLPASPAPASVPIAVPPNAPVPGPASLIAARIAPGVTITVDPGFVADPDALVARLAASLAPATPAPGPSVPGPPAAGSPSPSGSGSVDVPQESASPIPAHNLAPTKPGPAQPTKEH